MMDSVALEKLYRERLEERIVEELVREKGVSYEKAMEIYYGSRLAGMIQRGEYDMQYLDYKVLTQLLCEMQAK